MATLKLLQPPAEYPVTVEEAKTYLRVDGNHEDGRILTMISAAVESLEAYCDQKFISQKWAQYFDFWPKKSKQLWWDGVKELPVSELYSDSREICLMIGPLISIEEFNTYPDSGTAVLFPADQYIIDNSGPFGRIALPMGGVWPTTILRKLNGIEIKCTVGIAPNAAACPNTIKQAVLEFVGNLYEQRGDEKTVIPNTSMMLLNPYKRYKAGAPNGI